MTAKPRAFRLPPAGVETDAASAPAAETRLPSGAVVTEAPLDAIAAADGVPVIPTRRRSPPWLGLLLSALGGLASLAIGLGVERLIADLFAAAPWLGWVAVGFLAVAALSFAALVGGEVRGIWRERRIEALRRRAAEVLVVRDHDGAKGVARDLADLYADRPLPALGPRVADVADEIMDAEDRLALAERTLVAPRDAEAQRAVAAAAKQVSAVTALSPRAIVDVAFVVFAAVRLLRRVARIYGGRPGFLGALRLLRAALNHLAVTGGVAVGDSLLQQVLGLGLAARVSAKLGEGVLNGLMTARFGLSVIEVCRPIPFIRERKPRLGDVAGDLFSRDDPGRSDPA